MATNIVDVTDLEFAIEVLEESKLLPVMVGFYQEDCEACELVEPEFTAAAKEFDGVVKFVKAHAETCEATVEEYGIETFPGLHLFVAGAPVEEVPWDDGPPTHEVIRDFLNGHLEDDGSGREDDELGDDEDDEEA